MAGKNRSYLMMFCLSCFLFSPAVFSSESLSYSGRLVNSNGSPVPGPVTIKAELVYTNATAAILCTDTITGVTLTKGVFHVKLSFNCGATPFNQILAQIPTGESIAIRIIDVTNLKTYSFQAVHSIPFANMAEQLTQMGAVAGQFLKWDGTKWAPGAAGTGSGSVTSVATGTGLTGGTITTTGTISIANSGVGTAQIADGAVTDVKIGSVASSKITGTINSTQLLDGTILNADINAAAAIDYSKLNIPNVTIPYAKLNIADGDIPVAKINGLSTTLSALIEDAITDAVTGKAPSENAVFDALATKLNLTGGTLTIGTIAGVPTPVNPSEVTNKSYVDTADALKLNKAGDIMSGILTLDSDLKIKGGSNYVTIKGHATSGTFNFILPQTAGTSGYILKTDGSGNLSWLNPSSIPAGATTVDTAAIVDGTIVNADINATAAIAQSKIANLTTDLAAINTTIGALTTTEIAEGTNLYYTNARVLGLALTGLNTGTSGAVVATDTVLVGFGKLQYQVTALNSNGQWDKSGSDVVYSTGNVQVDNSLKFKDSATNTIAIKAPATVSTSYTLTLPAAKAASSGQVLSSDTSGVLSWSTMTDASVQTFAKAALPACAAGEVLKSNGTSFSCVTDNSGAGSFTGTINKVVVTDGSGSLSSSTVSSTELGYSSGVTSAIQTQLNAKEPSITAGTASQYYTGSKTFATLDTSVVPENTNLYFTAGRAQSAAVVDAISNGVTSTAPSQNAVFDALALKISTTGGTLSVGTINGVPTPTNSDEIVNKGYADTKLALAGGNLTGAVQLNTQNEVRFADSDSSNYVGLKSPATVASNIVWTLPAADGSAGQILKTNGSGVLSWVTDNSGAGAFSGTINKAVSTDGSGALITSATTATELGYVSGVTSSIQTQLNAKEPSITAGSTSQYLKGDKSLGTFASDVLATVLTGLSTATNSAISAADSLLISAGKLQAQITSLGSTKLDKTGGTLTVGTINGVPTPTSADEIVNKAYVDSFGQWSTSSGNVYRTSGNVGIGTTTPAYPLSLYRSSVGVTSNIESGANGAVVQNRYAGLTNAAATRVWGAGLNISLGDGEYEVYDYTAGASRLLINSSGNVGIGTVTPGSALDVKGTLRLSGSTSGFVGLAPAAIAGSTVYTLPAADGSSGQILKTNGSGVLSWVTDSTGAAAFSGTINKAVSTDGSGALTTSATTATELGYVSGVTSSIQTQLNAKEPSITAGSTSQYLKGDKSLGTFASDVLATALTGLSTATNSAITAADSVLVAFGKAQAQISNKLDKTGGTLTSGTIGGVPTPSAADEVVNKGYVDGFGQWAKGVSSSINYGAGSVGVGTTTPRTALDVNGAVSTKTAINNGTATVDFGLGNLQYTTSSCGTFQFNNMKDGASYTFAIQGTATASCTFSAYSDSGSTQITMHLPPDHGATTAGKHTVYTFVVMGTHVYSSWIPGY